MRVACRSCRHFVPDKINPPAGMGKCGHPKRKEPAYFYPTEHHLCRAHEPLTNEKQS